MNKLAIFFVLITISGLISGCATDVIGGYGWQASSFTQRGWIKVDKNDQSEVSAYRRIHYEMKRREIIRNHIKSKGMPDLYNFRSIKEVYYGHINNGLIYKFDVWNDRLLDSYKYNSPKSNLSYNMLSYFTPSEKTETFNKTHQAIKKASLVSTSGTSNPATMRDNEISPVFRATDSQSNQTTIESTKTTSSTKQQASRPQASIQQYATTNIQQKISLATKLNIDKAFELYDSAPKKDKFEANSQFQLRLKQYYQSKRYSLDIEPKEWLYSAEHRIFYWINMYNETKTISTTRLTGKNAHGVKAEYDKIIQRNLRLAIGEDKKELEFGDVTQLNMSPDFARKLDKVVAIFTIDSIREGKYHHPATVHEPFEITRPFLTIFAKYDFIVSIEGKQYKLKKSGVRYKGNTIPKIDYSLVPM